MLAPLAEEKDAERQDQSAQQASFSIPGYAAPPPVSGFLGPLKVLAGQGWIALGSPDQPGPTPQDALDGLDQTGPGSAGQRLGSAAFPRLPGGAGLRRANQGQPSQSLHAQDKQSLAELPTAAVQPPGLVRTPLDTAGPPDTHSMSLPNARQSGEVKSSRADAARGSAGRDARAAVNPSTASGTPADSESVRAVKSQLAFTGRLAPVAADVETPSPIPIGPQGPGERETRCGAGTSSQSVEPNAAAGASPVSPAGAADGEGADTPDTGSRDPSASDAPSHRGTDPTGLNRSREPESPAGSAGEASPRAGAANPAVANLSPEAQRSQSAGEAHGQPAAARLAREPEPAGPQKVARDITLELDSGSQRAAVRLVERGGEVHVAVRTPDAGLAADLRQGLPSLAAKLEQTGFRTETWHPGTAPRHPAEAAAGGAQQDRNDQNGQGSSRERREGQPQPGEPGQRPQPKKEGKNFAWFMSSLG